MVSIDQKTIENLSKLCKIQLTESESEKLLIELKRVVNYVEQLKELDTDNVLPCHHILENYPATLANDDIDGSISKNFLENAPDSINGEVKVPPVLKK